jgi:hypothetical protein
MHVVFPQDIIEQLDLLVGKRKRNRFITEATREHLKRIRLAKAIDRAAGSWKDEDHPEMTGKDGTSNWVRTQRTHDEERF